MSRFDLFISYFSLVILTAANVCFIDYIRPMHQFALQFALCTAIHESWIC